MHKMCKTVANISRTTAKCSNTATKGIKTSANMILTVDKSRNMYDKGYIS